MPRGWLLPLFVPATRPDRFGKAAASGADAVVIDLEDAVAQTDKPAARANVTRAAGLSVDLIVRINAADSPWFEDDCAAVAQSDAAAVMLPKSECTLQVARAAELTGKPVIALIETVTGAAAVFEIASAPSAIQLGLGTQDLAAALGCSPDSRLFDALRWNMVMASALHGKAAPLDGVSLELTRTDNLEAAGQALGQIGFAGKFCIHPRQIAPLRQGLCPSPADVERAERVLAHGDGAGRVGDMMVDAPVLAQAQRTLDIYRRLDRTEIRGGQEPCLSDVHTPA